MNTDYNMNESRKKTLEWIADNLENLKLCNESESVDEIVDSLKDTEAGGPIGLTREMLEGMTRS